MILLIKLTGPNGHKKQWKLTPKDGFKSVGGSRLADLKYAASEPFSAVVEWRENRWHYLRFSDHAAPAATVIENGATIDTLHFQLKEEPLFLLSRVLKIKYDSARPLQKLRILTRQNKIVESRILTGIVSDPGPGMQSQILDVNVQNLTEITKKPKASAVPRSYMAAFAVTALLVMASLIFAPEVPALRPPPVTLTSEITLKPRVRKSSGAVTAAAPASVQAPAASKGRSVNTAVAERISHLLGKVSATDKRTNVVLVNGLAGKSKTRSATRDVASVSQVASLGGSGRNWAKEGSGTGLPVSGSSLGSGKGIGSATAVLEKGKTGSGGVALIEDESEVMGGLDREVIAGYIKTQLGQILYCYERQLSATPELFGKIDVKFTIAGSGQVETQSIFDSTLKNNSVENCILGKIAKWKFPEPRGGTKVLVTYPFLFKSTQ